MKNKKYICLVTELSSLIEKFKEIDKIREESEFDLKWRLSQLYESVLQDDEQKFINISGMQGHLMTTEEKQELIKKEKEQEEKQQQKINENKLSDIIDHQKNNTDKKWAKDLYRRSIKRCHPDTIKTSDDEYKEELLILYKSITQSYEDLNLDILMVESYKLLIKPKEAQDDQIEILNVSIKNYVNKINNALQSQGYVWSSFNDEMKETFLINLMKQRGVRFVDKEKVKEILNRKVNNRKMGQRPRNILFERVKNKNK